MFFSYRRTGGLLALLAFVAAALVVTMMTVAVAVVILIVALTTAAAVLLGRAVLPRSWRRRAARSTSWPHETIEGTVVSSMDAADERDRLRMDSDKG